MTLAGNDGCSALTCRYKYSGQLDHLHRLQRPLCAVSVTQQNYEARAGLCICYLWVDLKHNGLNSCQQSLPRGWPQLTGERQHPVRLHTSACPARYHCEGLFGRQPGKTFGKMSSKELLSNDFLDHSWAAEQNSPRSSGGRAHRQRTFGGSQ